MSDEDGRGRCTKLLKTQLSPAATAAPAERKMAVTNHRIGHLPLRHTTAPIITNATNHTIGITVEGRGSSTILKKAISALNVPAICRCCNVIVVCKSRGHGPG